jgi:hypothetical protein
VRHCPHAPSPPEASHLAFALLARAAGRTCQCPPGRARALRAAPCRRYDVERSDTQRDYIDCLNDPSVAFRYRGLSSAIRHLEARLEGPCAPYDAVMGFSQGGVLLTLLTAQRLAAAASGLGSPPSWRANVLVASMPVRASGFEELFEAPLRFPATIVHGTADPFFEWGRKLETVYEGADVVQHDEGHRFPHAREVNEAFAQSVLRRLGLCAILAKSQQSEPPLSHLPLRSDTHP